MVVVELLGAGRATLTDFGSGSGFELNRFELSRLLGAGRPAGRVSVMLTDFGSGSGFELNYFELTQLPLWLPQAQ